MQLDVFFFDSYSLQSKFMGSSISAERNSLWRYTSEYVQISLLLRGEMHLGIVDHHITTVYTSQLVRVYLRFFPPMCLWFFFFCFLLFFLFAVIVVLEVKPRASHSLEEAPYTELHPQPLYLFFKFIVNKIY
jgi:hypothetical protein